MCGAAWPRLRRVLQSSGLSPRVWGSRRGHIHCPHLARSIPTCVGQPASLLSSYWMVAVYPHVCGAAIRNGKLPLLPQGLSPRVWGSRLHSHPSAARSRSIPTCVGQPRIVFLHYRPPRVYPHVCGAASSERILAYAKYGLSPRVWGSHVAFRCRKIGLGSIPTCVGQPWLGH